MTRFLSRTPSWSGLSLGRPPRDLTSGAVALGIAAALAVCLPGPALAQAPSDPDIGSRWPFEHTFASQPPRAQPVPGSACEVADEYVTKGASNVPNLFAEDGVFIGPYDIIYRGRAEIALWYGRRGAHNAAVAVKGPPRVIPLSFIDRGDECIMELANLRPNVEPGKPDQYRLVAVDHFTIGPDRKIKRLVIFIRPDPQEDANRLGISKGRAGWPEPDQHGKDQ